MLRITAVQSLVTLQDLGRFGWMRYGIPPSGAMDSVTMRIANMLVGNPTHYACLEIASGSISFAVEAERICFALTSGTLYLNNYLCSPWSSHMAQYGDTVTIKRSFCDGVWGYLAVAGGLNIPPMLNSLSTYTKAHIGGLHGRPLSVGDLLPLLQHTIPKNRPTLTLPASLRPKRGTSIRVLPGPQEDWFTPQSIHTFYSSCFTLSHRCDRMGYSLFGPKIVHKDDFNLISDPVAPGSIQIPGTQNPLVLLADRGTIGGYPKIATIISTDIPIFVQLSPTTQVSFLKTTLQDAIKAQQSLQEYLQNLPQYLCSPSPRTDTLIQHNLISGVFYGTGRH